MLTGLAYAQRVRLCSHGSLMLTGPDKVLGLRLLSREQFEILQPFMVDHHGLAIMLEIPCSIPALAIQGLSLAHSNSINRYIHKQTIINEPQ